MASLNKVMLIGRLTRDVEVVNFQNGGKLAKFGFAVSERRKNQQTGAWEDGDPLFVDAEAFNKGESGTLANVCEQYLRKGMLCYLEGRLKMDRWTDKNTNTARTKLKFVVDVMQMLESKKDQDQGQQGGQSQGGNTGGYGGQDDYGAGGGGYQPGNDEIPF